MGARRGGAERGWTLRSVADRGDALRSVAGVLCTHAVRSEAVRDVAERCRAFDRFLAADERLGAFDRFLAAGELGGGAKRRGAERGGAEENRI